MPSNLVKLVESAMAETQFRKVFTPQSENSFGRTAWSNGNFHVDYGVGPGARVLQVNKSTEETTLINWLRDQGSKGSHAALAKFTVQEKAKEDVTASDLDTVRAAVLAQL
jgi:hypothetical protein